MRPVLAPLPAFPDLCKQAEGYSPHIFWSVAEASHEQKAASGDFRLLPPWISLFWACILALDKMLFLYWVKIESHGFCLSAAPLPRYRTMKKVSSLCPGSEDPLRGVGVRIDLR